MINSAALKAEDLRFSEEGVKTIVKQVMLPPLECSEFLLLATTMQMPVKGN